MSFINEYKALGPAPEKTLRFFVSLPPPPPPSPRPCRGLAVVPLGTSRRV